MKYPVKITIEMKLDINENGKLAGLDEQVNLYLDVPAALYQMCYADDFKGYTGKGYQILTMGGIHVVAGAIHAADLQKHVPREMALEQSIDYLREILKRYNINVTFKENS